MGPARTDVEGVTPMAPDMPVRILVADDHDLILAGVSTVVSGEPGLQLVATARSAAELISRYRLFRPDVVLCDDRMPDETGLDAGRRILAEHPDARILVMSQGVDPDRVRDALKAGLRGWVSKSSTAELPRMLRRVAAGEAMVCDADTLQLLARDAVFAEHRTTLTSREHDVLRLMARGMVQKEIARELGMGVSTVKGHRRSIREKLGAETSEQAVHLATREGLI